MRDYKQEAVQEFAEKIKEAGFIVYLNDKQTYGIFTDSEKKRVVYFQWTFGEGVELSGQYKASKESGTGWGMGKLLSFSYRDIWDSLHRVAPQWANRNPTYTTLESYLKFYTAANYKELIT